MPLDLLRIHVQSPIGSYMTCVRAMPARKLGRSFPAVTICRLGGNRTLDPFIYSHYELPGTQPMSCNSIMATSYRSARRR
jgi:hypothetical protein